MLRHIFLLAGVLLLTSSSAHAQWLGTLSLDNSYDDNVFRNYSATASAATDLSLMYGYFPKEASWAVNYSASVSSYAAYPERLYSLQNLAASYTHAYGDNEDSYLRLLGSGGFRIDGSDYVMYDYSQALGTLSWRQQLTGDLPLLATYQARYRNYPNFGELSYLEHFAALGSMVFFETRTSIRVQAEYGFKNYLRTAFSNTLAASTGDGVLPSQSSGLTIDGDGPGGGGKGGGNNGGSGEGTGGSEGAGNGNGGGPGNGSGRMGLNNDGQHGGMESTVEYLMYEEPSTSQLRAWINIGQSLGATTGLSIRFLQRWNLTDRGRAFVGGAVDFIGEEELFDDPYSYESSEITLKLTRMMNWGMQLQMGVFYLAKRYDYPSTLDYTDPSVPSREDDRSGVWMRLEKRFGGDWLLFSNLRLSLGYVYMRNQSNTSYYDYASNAVSLGLSTDF